MNKLNSNFICGVHAVKTALLKRPEAILKLVVATHKKHAKISEIINLSERYHIAVEYVNSAWFEKHFKEVQHQGIAVACKPKVQMDLPALLNKLSEDNILPCVLVLDNVTSVQNLGALIRTAECAGCHAVIIPKDKAASVNAAVAKVSAGAVEFIPVITVTNITRTLAQLKEAGMWAVGTQMEASDSIYDYEFSVPVAIVLGSEDKGLRRLTSDNCDTLVHIPMLGKTESLNVNAAAAAILFEVVRQRMAKALH